VTNIEALDGVQDGLHSRRFFASGTGACSTYTSFKRDKSQIVYLVPINIGMHSAITHKHLLKGAFPKCDKRSDRPI